MTKSKSKPLRLSRGLEPIEPYPITPAEHHAKGDTHVTDYTHKRYLVENTRTGERRTATAQIGNPRGPYLKPWEKIVAVIGGYRKEN